MLKYQCLQNTENSGTRKKLEQKTNLCYCHSKTDNKLLINKYHFECIIHHLSICKEKDQIQHTFESHQFYKLHYLAHFLTDMLDKSVQHSKPAQSEESWHISPIIFLHCVRILGKFCTAGTVPV
ncbi:Hypothetical_protein [Hexamita inflata]|uniref:Hypothetical_protein n=1 Tax=Hexamita inflata TaxID=28002 RepID=A0ABP1K3T0_9EUKA